MTHTTPTKFKSVARCMMEFPDIESCLFLQQGQLVWSEVKPDVTRLLVHYLTTTLLPSLTSSSPQSASTVTHQVQISKLSTLNSLQWIPYTSLQSIPFLSIFSIAKVCSDYILLAFIVLTMGHCFTRVDGWFRVIHPTKSSLRFTFKLTNTILETWLFTMLSTQLCVCC